MYRLLFVFGIVFAGNEECAIEFSDCTDLVGFVKYHANATAVQMEALSDQPRILAGILSATAHTISALFVAKENQNCLTESVKFSLMMFIRHILRVDKMDAFGMIAAVQALRNSIQDFDPASPTQYYSHEHDGRWTLLESLRVHTFQEHGEPSNLCLLQSGILDLFDPGDRVADWGSGPLADHSVWFNRTGLVTSVPFDGSPNVGFVSEQKVVELDLADENIPSLVEGFDWIWLIDVMDTIIPEKAARILTNMSLAKPNKGVVLTWRSLPDTLLNPQSESQVLAAFIRAGFVLDKTKTELARNRCGETVFVFV